jgi:hypothetical protein
VDGGQPTGAEPCSWSGSSLAWGRVRVAESGVEPPRTIPNRVVPGASAGEYCVGDRVGGEAVARTRAHTRRDSRFSQAARGGAVAARWAHNPKVAGSNPAPATPGLTAG